MKLFLFNSLLDLLPVHIYTEDSGVKFGWHWSGMFPWLAKRTASKLNLSQGGHRITSVPLRAWVHKETLPQDTIVLLYSWRTETFQALDDSVKAFSFFVTTTTFQAVVCKGTVAMYSHWINLLKHVSSHFLANILSFVLFLQYYRRNDYRYVYVRWDEYTGCPLYVCVRIMIVVGTQVLFT